MRGFAHRLRWTQLACLALLVALSAFATSATAAGITVTYTATQTIPVPPASNYAGSAGGDGWAVAMTPTAVYNVFHHNGSLQVACHLQTDASQCWSPKTITQTENDVFHNFQVSGEPGLWLDQPTGHLFVFVTRTPDQTGGVACFDTKAAADVANPFCGFTALTAAGESPQSSWSAISAPAAVGSRWFAFNYVSGSGVTGAKNTLLCFDLTTLAACAGQPFPVALGNGESLFSSLPTPSVAAVGSDVIIPVRVDGANRLACFDGSALASCAGSWPVAINFNYSVGGPFPLLTADGNVSGVCLPYSGAPCYSLAGASVATPDGLAQAMGSSSSSPWNGPPFVLGPRVYVPNGNTNAVHCYDYNLQAGCANFPKSFNQLGYLYTVNSDPQRPTCIWVNADNGGRQIQNFDAYTGGACGAGAIRVLASQSVVTTPLCTPGSWNKLQVTTPTRDQYTSGTISFQDGSANPIPGVGDVALDANGAADLTGLNLNTGTGLPQFLITLNGTQGAPGQVVVNLTWTGTFDPTCGTKPGTTVVNPPSGGPSKPAKSDVSLTLAAPQSARTGQTLAFTGTVTNTGADTSTGVLVRAKVPAGVTIQSASTSRGGPCSVAGLNVQCPVGTLASGSAATLKFNVTTANAGTLTMTGTAEADFDTNTSNNTSSASAQVISPTAAPLPPPAPSQPGTFNAITSGTVLVNGVPVSADQIFLIKSGDIIDVTNGVLTMTASDGSWVTWSFGQPTSRRVTSSLSRSAAGSVVAQFRIEQAATAGSLVTATLVGGDFAGCTTPRQLWATNKNPVRQLWGSAKGNFKTSARYSSATVRGTIWFVQDRCDGTFSSVVEGVVDVADTVLGKTVSVSAGQSYLAVPKGTFKPPAVKKAKKASSRNSAANIKRRGLIWSNQVFANRAAFETWLVDRGRTWQGFQQAYPKLAAALAARK